MAEAQHLLTSSNQTHGNTDETRVVMVDKVIHVTEVTSEKVNALTLAIPNHEPRDNLQNPTMGVDQCKLHGETIDQSNSKTIQEDILPCGSSVLGNTDEICKGNNGQVSRHS